MEIYISDKQVFNVMIKKINNNNNNNNKSRKISI